MLKKSKVENFDYKKFLDTIKKVILILLISP